MGCQEVRDFPCLRRCSSQCDYEVIYVYEFLGTPQIVSIKLQIKALQVSQNEVLFTILCFRSFCFQQCLALKARRKNVLQSTLDLQKTALFFVGIYIVWYVKSRSNRNRNSTPLLDKLCSLRVLILQSIQTLLLILQLNQSLFTVLPSKPSLRPGMIITFEVYLLKGNVVNTDRVVAWGCFPVCDGTFEVIEGK